VWALPIVALALVVAGCNLPTSQTATVFNDSVSQTGCTGPLAITIYLVNTNTIPERLAPVSRPDSAKTGDKPLCALNALNAGPTSDEQIRGIETKFVEIPELLGLSDVSGGVATVQLDAGFLAISPAKSLYQAFGQIVYTLTGLGVGIDRVQFVFDNIPYVGVLLPSGKVRRSGRVSRADYCAIGPVDQGCAA
jgi:spore germination protein GerM